MRNFIRRNAVLGIIGLLGAAGITAVPATRPVAGAQEPTAGPPSAPHTIGHVLVLDNERTLEGDVEQHGGQFCIKRAIGMTWIPAGQVLCLCADRREAYLFLRDRANLRDPDERLRLAKWCHRLGLRAEALAEAEAAVTLRPNHPESRRFLSAMQRADTDQGVAPAAVPVVRQAGLTTPATRTAKTADLPAFDLSADAVALFGARVQPILMNTCATCHVSGGGTFRLIRVSDSATFNRRATQQNAAAVLAQLTLDHPGGSPLLLKAVSVHGDAALPPIKNKQAPAFRTLEEWVRLVQECSPGLEVVRAGQLPPLLPVPAPDGRPGGGKPAAAGATPPAAASLASATEFASGDLTPPDRPPAPPASSRPEAPKTPGETAVVPVPDLKPVPPPPSPPAGPPVRPGQAADDPYDPAEFNRSPG